MHQPALCITPTFCREVYWARMFDLYSYFLNNMSLLACLDLVAQKRHHFVRTCFSAISLRFSQGATHPGRNGGAAAAHSQRQKQQKRLHGEQNVGSATGCFRENWKTLPETPFLGSNNSGFPCPNANPSIHCQNLQLSWPGKAQWLRASWFLRPDGRKYQWTAA